MARKSKSQSHGPDNKPGIRNDAFPSGPHAEEEYKVGPGRPPKEHQFKPGQSGNPKGAKCKAPSLLPDLKEQFERVLLIRKEIVCILEVARGRFPFETLKKKVMGLKRKYNPSTLLIEDSPISLGLIQSLREQSINVTTNKPDTDKRARLIAQTDLFAGGSVCLPRRVGWLEEFVAELLSFPGRHDDQVDALTRGLAWGRQRWSRKVVVSLSVGVTSPCVFRQAISL